MALLVIAVVGIGVTAGGSDARAARGVSPVSSWIVDGTVYAVAATAKDVVLGGDFTLIGRASGTWAAVDQDGAVHVRSVVSDTVSAAVMDGRGGWYLAGDIGSVGGVARTRVVHLLASGGLDVKWHPEVNGKVDALTRTGTTLFLGGEFTKFGGLARAGLAAVDIKTGGVMSWNPGVAGKKDADVYVSALAPSADGRTVYIGGAFTRIAGHAASNVGAADAATGKARAWRPVLNNDVTALGATGGVVYVAGDFTKVGGRAQRPRGAERQDRQADTMGSQLRRQRVADCREPGGLPGLRRR